MSLPIGPRLHGAIDYGFVALQALAPTLFNLRGSAKTLCYAFAGNQAVLNALTNQPYAVKKLVPFRVHGQLETPVALGNWSPSTTQRPPLFRFVLRVGLNQLPTHRLQCPRTSLDSNSFRGLFFYRNPSALFCAQQPLVSTGMQLLVQQRGSRFKQRQIGGAFLAALQIIVAECPEGSPLRVAN
jgi:hypothetical protein